MKKQGIIIAESSKAGTPQKSPRLSPAPKQRPIITQLTDQQLTNYLKSFVTISDYKQIDQGKQLLKLISEQKNEKKIQQTVQIICYFFQHAQSEGRVCGLQFMKQLMEVRNLKIFLLIEKYLLQYIIDAVQYRYNIKSVSRGSTYFLAQVDKHEKDSKISQIIRMSNTYCRMSHEILFIWGAKYFPNSHFGIVFNKLSKYCVFPLYPTDFRFYREEKIIQTANSQKVKEINLYVKNRKSKDISALSSRSNRSNRSRKSTQNNNKPEINKKQPNIKKQQPKQEAKQPARQSIKQPIKQTKNIIPKLPLKEQKIQQKIQQAKPEVIRQQPQQQSQISSQAQQQDEIFKSQNTHSTFIQKGSKIVSKPKNKLAQKQKIPRNVIYRQSSIEDPQDLTGEIDQVNKKTRLKLKNNMNNKDIDVPMGIISQIMQQNSSKANQTGSNLNSHHQSQHNKTNQMKSSASKSQKSGKNTPNSPKQVAKLQNIPNQLKNNLSVCIEDMEEAELGQSQHISPNKAPPQKQNKNVPINITKVDKVDNFIKSNQNPTTNADLNNNKSQNTGKVSEQILNKGQTTIQNKEPYEQQAQQSQRLRGSIVQSQISSQKNEQQIKQQKQKDYKQQNQVNPLHKTVISQKIEIQEINKTDFPSVIIHKNQHEKKTYLSNEDKKNNSNLIQSKQQHRNQKDDNDRNTKKKTEEIKFRDSTQNVNKQYTKQIINQKQEKSNNIGTFENLSNSRNKNVDPHVFPGNEANQSNQKVPEQKTKQKQQNRYKKKNYTQKSQQKEPNKKIPVSSLSQTHSHEQKSIKKSLRSTSIKKNKVFESSSSEQQNNNPNPPNKKYPKTKLTYNHVYQYQINETQKKLFSNVLQTPQIKYGTKKDKISRFHKFRQVSLNFIPEKDNKNQQQKQQIQNKQQQIQTYKKQIHQKQLIIQKQAKLSQLILNNIENLQDKLTSQKQYIDGIKSSILDEIQSQQQKISKDHTQSAWEIKQMLKQKQILTPIYQNSLSSTKKHRFPSKNSVNSIPLQSFFGESKNIQDNSYLPGYNSEINMKKRSKSNSSKRSSNSSLKIKNQIDLYQQGTMLYCMAKRKAYFT